MSQNIFPSFPVVEVWRVRLVASAMQHLCITIFELSSTRSIRVSIPEASDQKKTMEGRCPERRKTCFDKPMFGLGRMLEKPSPSVQVNLRTPNPIQEKAQGLESSGLKHCASTSAELQVSPILKGAAERSCGVVVVASAAVATAGVALPKSARK